MNAGDRVTVTAGGRRREGTILNVDDLTETNEAYCIQVEYDDPVVTRDFTIEKDWFKPAGVTLLIEDEDNENVSKTHSTE